jgi:rhomboid protease GluP
MEKRLYNQINDYFKNRQYQKIPTDIENVAMYGVYDKSNLYLINVIELGPEFALDPERYLEYKQLTMQQFSKTEADKVILLNLIIAKETQVLYDAFNFVPDLSERFIDVVWFINENTRKLQIPKRQLKNILNIDKEIKKILNNEETTYYKLKPRKAPIWITWVLMSINIAIWVSMEIKGSSLDIETLIGSGAMSFPLVVIEGEYYRLVTAMFLHIGAVHLFHNMFSLYIFGYRLERYLKVWQYMVVYLGSGLLGSLMSLGGAYITGMYPVAAGASGAVYGLIGSLLVVTNKIKKPIDGVSSYILWVMFGIGIIFSVLTPNVDTLAHIGGFAGGIMLTHKLLKPAQKTDVL